MECIGLVAEAVGVEVFAQDAMEIMQIFHNLMAQDKENDMDTFEYTLPACARISKALGPQFEQFLPMVMEPLLKGASQQTDCSVEDAMDDDVEGETRDEETGIETAANNQVYDTTTDCMQSQESLPCGWFQLVDRLDVTEVSTSL